MNDERIVHLLEEIRDLQKENAERYKDAVTKQQELLRQSQKRVFIGVFLVLFFTLLFALFGK